MSTRLSIGDFSRMTFLSVKTLRHYHEVGLLAPAEIDAHSGYRYYRPDQVGSAQLIRRLRDLDLPVPQVREVLAAPDATTRDAVIAQHLDRMTRQLEQTQATVESLRRLLFSGGPELEVSVVEEPDVWALVARAVVGGDEAPAWWVQTFTELHAALRSARVKRTGPDGTLFPTEFFTEGAAELTCFVPVPEGTPGSERIAGDRLATTVYDGPFGDLDTAYGVVGTTVTERAIASDGPIRERYLPRGDEDDLLDHRTVVCWPVTAAD
ncbi:transcriptional regulator [Intrasporangium oryzae NRRL B-24470]|uniref:Transcriptional regulator n=1 Tax=Intrasporangium oryzae NRRL B-24470 TaxID=1386089 RepID=W9G7C6_9MICO|nr:MerR family transcriptional regulator [Intrasporangium oryzae]EWT02056.1 transcriptional regulator [Intrasporangium oryzae NRRL B-24470]